MSANAHIVAHLHKVVDLGAFADDGVTDSPTINGRPGSDLNVILDNNTADLRHFKMSFAAHHKAESILPDIASRVDDHPITNQSIADHRITADRTIAPDPNSGADHGICSNGGSSTDFDL